MSSTNNAFTWQSKDKRFRFGGELIKPPHFDPAKRYPLVVYYTGGHLQTKDQFFNEYDPGLEMGGVPLDVFAVHGYMVLIPNHRGMRAMSPEMEHAFIGHAGDHITLDVDAAVDDLIARGWVDSNKLAVIGHSAGSEPLFHTIATEHRWKAAVDEDGMYMLPEYSAVAHYLTPTDCPYCDTYDMIAKWMGRDIYSPVYSDPHQVTTPLLIRVSNFYGMEKTPAFTRTVLPIDTNYWNEEDPFAFAAMIERIAVDLRSRNVPVEVLEDRDAHGVANPDYRKEYVARVLGWLDYYVLGTGDNPLPAKRWDHDYSADISAALKRKAGR